MSSATAGGSNVGEANLGNLAGHQVTAGRDLTVSRLPKLTKVFYWTVENFKSFAKSIQKNDPEAPRPTYTFPKEGGIGPSKWSLAFETDDEDDNKLCIFICCEEFPTVSSGTVRAAYSILMTCKEKPEINPIGTYTSSPEEFRVNNANGYGCDVASYDGPVLSALSDEDSVTIKVTLDIHGSWETKGLKRMWSDMDIIEEGWTDISDRMMFKLLLHPESTGSDFVLHFPNENAERRAHKWILADRSSVFKTMFESGLAESSSGKAVIEDISAKAMQFDLNFIYTGRFGILAQLKANDDENTDGDGDGTTTGWQTFAEDIAYAADKYDLTALKAFCDLNLISACNKDNALTLLNLSTLLGMKTAAGDIASFVKENHQKVSEGKSGKTPIMLRTLYNL